ncbi:hypothetical protein [Deinococcus humi]|uniref:GrpB-like predicted nucleotidyltransferase (UPF0157 family) n=1 Tax=Deinococcus humi TaxID=662880 RepID=A0A7W8NJ36_9DEIO|nr:hypothetical protein [Deinococcus humi]MBB5365717.1 GrpB-like predicted nucleotidyltransferase (UPF0157 family) [Deinococcus humi]GGO38476.1 hypothetical protein GCM10008949_45090 [Deinococcus humi]
MKGSLKVSDIAHPDTTTQFISDVQLSTFHDALQLNRDLMQRFMFTKGTGGRADRKGTAELLKLLHQRVTPIGQKEDNRFVFMATYGHGKSHFGLSLANFFGAEAGSPELESIFGKLDYSLPADQLQMLRDYRASKAPFLVLILRGDKPGSLRDTFFQALDRALGRSEKAKNLKPPFWFDRADEILERLESKAADTKTVNKFLAAHDLDLPSLRQLVRERQARAYHLSVEAIAAVHGVQPNLGGETSLADAVNWIVTDLCGPGKPFGGLLVLFDEFSRFIQDYIQNNPVGAPLQELLSGIGSEAARGKALFVGLSQHDPNVIAERYGAGEELVKELNRLPHPNRHVMQTMLEDVLGGVLKTDERGWQTLNTDPHIGMTISGAADTALALFAERYGPKQLNWNLTTIMEKVAKQCFPLHPLTTAFLASVTLHSTGTVRSVLGFIQDKEGYVMPRFDEPAVREDGQPNWVLPIRLVDYFGEALHEEKFKNYKNVFKPDLMDEQQAVLKAMLLLDVAELPTKRAGGYVSVVATLAGLGEKEAQETLESLEKQHYIRHDSVNKTYSFFVGSNDVMTLDRLLSEEITHREEKKTIGQLFETFTGGTNPVNRLGLTNKHKVSISWGHEDDWAAQEILVPASAVNASLLAALRTKYAVEVDKAPEGRGAVVLVIPKTQKEANEAAGKINELLSSSDKDKTAPLLFLIPQEAQPDLHTQLLKLAVLGDPMFKVRAQSEVGPSALTELAGSLSGRAKKTLTALRANSAMLLPPMMTAGWAARAKPNFANRLGEALKFVYELAYPYHPDAFFTQYGLSTNNLSTATMILVADLMENSLDKEKIITGGAKKVAEDLQKMLQKEWKVITLNKQLAVPELTKLKHAWQRLDNVFSAKLKRQTSEEVFRELLSPPYGYDQNTLSLIFSAWYGVNSDSITLSGANVSRAALSDRKVYKNPGSFLKIISTAFIEKRDIQEERAHIDLLLSRMRNQQSEAAVLDVLRLFRDFLDKNPKYDSNYIEKIEKAIEKLENGLSNMAKHDEFFNKFIAELNKASIHNVGSLHERLRNGVPELTLVKSKNAGLEELSEKLINRTQELLDEFLKSAIKLHDISSYEKNLDSITSVAKTLNKLGLTEMKAQTDVAVNELIQAKAGLEAEKAENAHLQIVNSYPTSGTLDTLRATRQKLRTFPPTTLRVKELLAQKLEAVEHLILQLESNLTAWDEVISRVVDVSSAVKLNNELLSQSAKYEGTPEAERVTELQGKAAALSRYFSILSQNSPLYDPADVERRSVELQALAEEYAGLLTPAQQEGVGSALSKLSEKKANEEAKAAEWLSQQQARFATEDTKGLDKVLNAPPRFLSDAGQEALSELRSLLIDKASKGEQEAQQLRLIRSFATMGSISALEANLSELGKITSVTTGVQDVVKEQREKTEAELARLRGLPAKWTAVLSEATTVQALSSLAKDLTRQEAYLRGTSDEETVTELTTRVETVQGILRRADDLRGSTSMRLRDLTERRTEQEKLSGDPALSPAQQQLLTNDAAHTAKLFETEINKLDARLSTFQDKLDAVRSLADLDKVELGTFPRAGLPEDRLGQLKALEGQRDALRPLLSELATLDQQLWRDIGEAQDLLRKYTALFEASAWSERQRQLVGDKRALLVENLIGKRQQASAWLSKHEAALPTLNARGLSQLEKELAQPQPFLDATEKGRFDALRTGLQARLEEDQALQIETLFEKIESPQRRASLLTRLQQILVAETA